MGNSNETMNQIKLNELAQENGLSNQVVEDIHQKFLELDIDNKGSVSKKDFIEMMENNSSN